MINLIYKTTFSSEFIFSGILYITTLLLLQIISLYTASAYLYIWLYENVFKETYIRYFMITSAQQSIARQRDALSIFLSEPLKQLAGDCAEVWDDIENLENSLRIGLAKLPYCSHLYATDLEGIQITAGISMEGDDRTLYGTDRSQQPFMRSVLPSADFILSESYISERSKRPSITAVQIVTAENKPVGFISAHFDLRKLPLTAPLYVETNDWIQMKGDPSIRSGLFSQQRVESVLDQHIDTVISVIEELMIEHGVFHCEIYFSSSRAIIWNHSDPYSYRTLTIDELIDPDVCLMFSKTAYPEAARIAPEDIRKVLESFRDLRFADETVYLRNATLNIYNGKVGLTFSCDGSHSISATEFLSKGLSYWIGSAAAGMTTVPGCSIEANIGN